ncbi:MAG: hypothetical protein MZV63_58670 [Marinilabiliales bacterium]|nr:hypothetical protein [Marinilabiliales bacterium]
MGPAFRRLTDEPRPLERLHVVGEGFGGREGVRPGQDEEGHVEPRFHADVAAGPALGQGAGLAGIGAAQLGRVRQEVAAQVVPRAAAVLPDVDDDGPGVGQEGHGGDGHVLGLVEGIEPPQIDIADAGLDPFELVEAGILLEPQAIIPDGMMQGPFGFFADVAGHHHPEIQMLVAGDGDEVGGDFFGEVLGVGQRVVGPGSAFRPEFVGVGLGFLRQDILALDDIGDLAKNAFLVGFVRETLLRLGRKEDRPADDEGRE